MWVLSSLFMLEERTSVDKRGTDYFPKMGDFRRFCLGLNELATSILLRALINITCLHCFIYPYLLSGSKINVILKRETARGFPGMPLPTM